MLQDHRTDVLKLLRRKAPSNPLYRMVRDCTVRSVLILAMTRWLAGNVIRADDSKKSQLTEYN